MTQPSEIQHPLMQEVMKKCSGLNIPIQVALELTYRCNLQCAHCYIDISEADELTLEEWKGVLDQLKAAGTMYIALTGGEIMVRQDFLDIATYARRNGFLISFMTNCTLVTPYLSRAIAELQPFTVGTSLYGATAATHEAVTRVSGSFQRTLAGIKLFVDAGLIPTVQTIAMKTNIAELSQMKEVVESVGATVHIEVGMAPSKTGALFPFQYEPVAEDLLDCRWLVHASDRINNAEPQLCRAGKSYCSISPEGNVFPCLMFPMKLGNLRQSSFESVWRLEPRAELRYLRSMRRSDLYACNGCELVAYCDRCTGSAYLESGRADGPSPSACRQAEMRWRLAC